MASPDESNYQERLRSLVDESVREILGEQLPGLIESIVDRLRGFQPPTDEIARRAAQFAAQELAKQGEQFRAQLMEAARQNGEAEAPAPNGNGLGNGQAVPQPAGQPAGLLSDRDSLAWGIETFFEAWDRWERHRAPDPFTAMMGIYQAYPQLAPMMGYMAMGSPEWSHTIGDAIRMGMRSAAAARGQATPSPLPGMQRPGLTPGSINAPSSGSPAPSAGGSGNGTSTATMGREWGW